MMRLTLLAAILLAAPLQAQELSLPATVAGEVGAFIVVKADTPDSLVKWRVVDAGLNLFPQELQKDTKVAVVVSLRPGRYRILAVSAKDGIPSDIAECTVVIGGAPPTPVPPGPT